MYVNNVFITCLVNDGTLPLEDECMHDTTVLTIDIIFEFLCYVWGRTGLNVQRWLMYLYV